MNRKVNSLKPFHTIAVAVAFILSSSLLLLPDVSSARRGGSDDRVRFYGIVESRPIGGVQGDWVIGGRVVTTDPGTEFDQSEGPLTIGSCAKVDFRNGRLHEIDSEPFRDCQ